MALVADYQDGSTVYDLAAKYHVNRDTVSRILKRRGVIMRRRSPNTAEIDEAGKLYDSGSSLAKVGAQLGFDNTTICHALHKAGVPMRPRRGGNRRTN